MAARPVWVDLSREQVFTHVHVKSVISGVLWNLVEQGQLGLWFNDGLLLSSFAADISGKPDGTFLSHSTLNSDRIRLIEGKDAGIVEVQGSPDMVLEVVSKRSVKKDLEELRRAYWEAGIGEYWLVDARAEPVRFDILRHTARGYTAARKVDGWLKSAVFGRSFRLSAGMTVASRSRTMRRRRMPMSAMDVNAVNNNFIDCLRRVEAGETLVLTRDGRPVAELRPADRAPRIPNMHPGAMVPAPDFDDELPEDFWFGGP